MKARVQLWGIIDTVAHAQTVKQAVTDELVGKDIFELHDLDWTVLEDSSVEFTFDARFNTDLDRNAIVTWIRNQLAEHPTVKTWFLELKVWWHTCDHDNAEPDGCSDATLTRWQLGDPWP